MCSVVLIYGSSNFRLAVRGVLVTATPLTEVIIGCFEGSLRFATPCEGGRLAAVVVGEEDMPDELGALVAGAVAGSGGGFILGADEGVVEGGRVDVRVVAIVLRNGVDLVSIYFRELPRQMFVWLPHALTAPRPLSDCARATDYLPGTSRR